MILPSLIEAQNDEEFLDRGTRWLADQIRKSITERGTCVLGLSGGSTPRAIYAKLSAQAEIDWSKLWCFLADERYVPADHADSNTKLVHDTLLAGIKDAHFIHPITTLPLEECIQNYEQSLRDLFDAQGMPDLAVLGMGPDGHIASLFPPVVDDAFGAKLAIHTTTDAFAVHDRISITLPTLRQTPTILFLLKGQDKLRVWQEMMAAPKDAKRWPAQHVMEFGQTTVLIAP